MSPDPPPPAAAVVRPRRPAWAVLGERAIEALVRLSGVSAIVFVAAIFFFVLREAAPVLVKDDFSLVQFLFSGEWYPTSCATCSLPDSPRKKLTLSMGLSKPSSSMPWTIASTPWLCGCTSTHASAGAPTSSWKASTGTGRPTSPPTAATT